MKKKVFKVFANCVVTKGYNRVLITDSQRGCYYLVPLAMSTYIFDNENQAVEEIMNQFAYDSNTKEILNEYFNFLFEKELIFECNEAIAQNFPAIEKEFCYPAAITNAVIELKQSNLTLLGTILDQFAALRCSAFNINIKEKLTHTQFYQILNVCKAAEIDDLSISLIENFDIDFENLKRQFPFLSLIELTCSDANDEHYEDIFDLKIIRSKSNLQDVHYCGVVSEKHFNIHLLHYTESLHHNTCLNRKIAIDAEGNIKNCPSMKERFGNIKDTTLEEAINKPGFKNYWNIKKDEITKCKDCEFRHVCTDCRAYLDDPDEIYSAPLKCGYDPYTCTWEEWSINPLKQKAIDYYRMKEIIAENG